ASPFRLVLLDGHMPGMDGFMLAERIRESPALLGTPLVMLTSAGVPEDVERCRALGIRAYLTKPFKQSELVQAILTVLGHSSESRSEPLPSAASPRSLRVLVAEDSQVNQVLAARLLEKEGHTVQIVGTGQAALTALESATFDAVLMDVQMPVLDGLSATAQ